MSDHQDSDWLRDVVALVFRAGTLISIATIAIGYVLHLAGDGEPERGSLLAQIVAGGPGAIMAVGLFGLTLLPVGVVVALAVGFARGGERGRAILSVGVLVLLLASLATAALLAPPG